MLGLIILSVHRRMVSFINVVKQLMYIFSLIPRGEAMTRPMNALWERKTTTNPLADNRFAQTTPRQPYTNTTMEINTN